MKFIKSLLAGYEPAMARSIALAVFVLLGAFGLGSGNLPPQVEAILTFLAFALPLLAGWLIRQKVIPMKSVELPDDPYPDGYLAAVADDVASDPLPGVDER